MTCCNSRFFQDAPPENAVPVRKEQQLSRVQIFALAVACLLTLAIFQLIRSRKLKEQYSLLWFLTVAVLFILALWERPLEKVSETIGIVTPANTLFILALLFLFVMALHFSLLVSRLTDQSKMLAQRLALLERDLRKQGEAGAETAAGDEAADEPG
jgi:hypothetical protein